jgi:sec-independent protein translocase protein TatB
MFDIGFSKIIVIFGLALVVLGPEKLPRVAATVGRWVGRARVMAKQFRDQLEQESEGLRKETDGLREAAADLRKGTDSLRDVAAGLRRDLDPNAPPVMTPAPSPVPMTATPAGSAEPVLIPDPGAPTPVHSDIPVVAPEPAVRAPLHSDSPEVTQQPPAPTPESPAPKHEPGT